MGARGRPALETGCEAQAAFRRLQRNAQYRLRCARRRNAAAGASNSRAAESRVERNDAEFRSDVRLLWRREAGSFAGRLSAFFALRGAEERWRGGVRRLNVQKQVR